MFTIDRLGGYLLALLGRQKYYEYEVRMIDDVGNVRVEYVLAPDVERAASDRRWRRGERHGALQGADGALQ